MHRLYDIGPLVACHPATTHRVPSCNIQRKGANFSLARDAMVAEFHPGQRNILYGFSFSNRSSRQITIRASENFPQIGMLQRGIFWNSFFFFLIVCFTSYFMFSIAVLPHSPDVAYYHLLLRQETRIPGVAPFPFRKGIWDLFVHRGQKSYTPTAFGKLYTTPGVRCLKHASS